MKALFWLLAALITYGSIFPFRFAAATPEAWRELVDLSRIASRGDLLANIVLFLPFGYLGVLAGYSVTRVFLMAALLGFGLQLAQVWVPARVPTLLDGTWNMIGAVVGVVFARRLRPDTMPGKVDRDMVMPLTLIACWLAYRLVPFVPSLDFQEIEDSLKPLLKSPDLAWPNVLHDTVAWLVVAHLLQRYAKQLWLLIALTFAAEVLIVQNTVSASNVAGAAAALTLWWTWLARTERRTVVLAASLAAMIVVVGLQPFTARATPEPLHWIPFHGFLGGSMMINAAVAFEKSFLYGALVWLLRESGLRLRVAVAIAVFLTLGVELAQTRIVDHLPEITDPLLVAIMGFLIHAFDRYNKAEPGGVSP